MSKNRSLVLYLGNGAISIAEVNTMNTNNKAIAKNRRSKENGKWGVYAEVSCGDKTRRSPVIEASVARSGSRLSLLQSRKNKGMVNLSLDWNGWFAEFPEWARTMQASVVIYARNQNSERVHVAKTYLPLSSVKTSTVNRSYSLVGERCEVRQSIGLCAMISTDVPPMSHMADSGIHFDACGKMDGYASDGSVSDWSGEDVSDDECDDETKQVIDKTKRHIRETFVSNGWKSLLSGPLDGQVNVTFSRGQLKELFSNLGVKLSRREWGVLMRYHDPHKQNAVPYLAVKKFLDDIETDNTAVVSYKGSRKLNRKLSLTPYANGESSGEDDGEDYSKHRFRAGDRVEARFMNGKDYVKGVVERVRRKGKALEIRYVDGSYENLVPLDRVRHIRQKKSRHYSSDEENNLSRFAGFDKDSSDSEADGAESDEDQVDYASLGPDAQRALEIIQSGVRRAQNAATERNAHFSFASLLENFADIPTRPGRMSNEAFHDAMDQISISLRSQYAEALLERLDTHSKGSLNWHLLLRLVQVGSGTVISESVPSQVNETLHRLRRAVKKSRARGVKPREPFEMFDKTGSGFVSLKCLEKACALLGCTISKVEARGLDDRLRTIAPNTPPCRVNYDELLNLLEDGSKGFHSGRFADKKGFSAVELNDAVKRLRAQIQEISASRRETLDLAKPFEAFDHNGDGVVTFLQFTSAIQKLGLITPIEDLQVIAAKCSGRETDLRSKNSGRHSTYVDYKKFESLMCTDLSIAAALRPQLSRAAARGLSAWAAFKAVDKKETGLVSRVDFRRTLLSTLGIRMKEHELRRMMDKFNNKRTNSLGSTRVLYGEFLDFVAPSGEAGHIADDISGLESKLRHSIRSKLSGSPDTLSLPQVFGLFDRKGRNFCTHAEFFGGLKHLGIGPLNPQDRKLLLNRFDPRGNGKVDYASFVKFAGFSELEMDEIACRVVERLKEVTMNEGVGDYSLAFQVFDMGKSGFVTRREFREGVRTLGLPLTEAELHVLTKRFAQFDNDDLIQYQDFLRFVINRRSTADARLVADHMQEADRVRRKGLHHRRGRRHRDDRDREDEAEERLTVNGSGYDGLTSRGGGGNFLKSVLAGDESGTKIDGSVNSWLETGASDKERRDFHRLGRSLKDFKDSHRLDRKEHKSIVKSQHGGEVFYDHGEQTVSRVVDHGQVARRNAHHERQQYLLGNDKRVSSARARDGAPPARTSMYDAAHDWKLQWKAPDHDDVMRSIVLDAFYPDSSAKKHRKGKKKKHHRHHHRRRRRSRDRKHRSRSKSPRSRSPSKRQSSQRRRRRSYGTDSSSSESDKADVFSKRQGWRDDKASVSTKSDSSDDDYYNRRSRRKRYDPNSSEESDSSSTSSGSSSRRRSRRRQRRSRSRSRSSSRSRSRSHSPSRRRKSSRSPSRRRSRSPSRQRSQSPSRRYSRRRSVSASSGSDYDPIACDKAFRGSGRQRGKK